MIKNLKYLIRYIAVSILVISIILFVYLLNNYRSLFNTLNTNYDAGKIPLSESWKEQTASENSFVWVGHATILLNLDGENILIDPIFSERASPFSFIGPRRLISPAIPINELPNISKVLISHNHYDHLDIPTLIFHNINDARVPISESKFMAANIKNSKFVPLNGNNHVILENDEGWPIFQKELKNFLK